MSKLLEMSKIKPLSMRKWLEVSRSLLVYVKMQAGDTRDADIMAKLNAIKATPQAKLIALELMR